MAKMLMAAALVGGATAALVLYLQRRVSAPGKKELAGKNAKRPRGLGEGERLGTAAMG